jgi:hypothetical protein
VAALGHGRSYGARSRFLCRDLPGILESGLWPHLNATAAVSTRALITDVGNDIIYGFPADQILAWVDEAIRRLQRHTDNIVLTGLPLASIRRVSPRQFKVVCTVIAPSCRLTLPEVVDRCEVVGAGLAAMAASRAVEYFELDPSWYGADPIHIRPRYWRLAWQQILGTTASVESSFAESLRLYSWRAEREWWFGRERLTPQAGRSSSGARIWLY